MTPGHSNVPWGHKVKLPDLPYDRDMLVTVLVYHQATNTSGCHCGWAELGRSHAEHVANVYEQSVRAGA